MKNYLIALSVILLIVPTGLLAQKFDGLDNNLSNLYRMSDAKTRSISPENFTGEKGKGGMSELGEGAASHEARELGQGYKVSPYVIIEPGEVFTMAEIDGPGCIQHIWLTPTGDWRFYILRFYWDDEDEPSVEVPVGDFFGMGWGEYAHLNSLAVCVNPGRAFNCYWQMPFKKKCKITMENIDVKPTRLYYQVDYVLTNVPDDAAYFHAQFRNPDPDKDKEAYTIVDNIKGKGQYVGTYMAWQVNNNGWWGEGEIKFYMDGDKDFPTICGTGEEDYFCGSYGYNDREIDGKMYYSEFSSLYTGFYEVKDPEIEGFVGVFGQYRWHIEDPIRFEEDLKITIQCLGWGPDGYLPLEDELASVAYWYQTEPHHSFPPLPSKENLVIRKSIKE
ncbi:MAG: DUF2961 domain-containing protein [Bacteroidales bacterium]|nr:DUF2961 domain-containing protein [Bacteroidales bacterium]